MYHKPKVSIIIPAYNSEKYIQKAFDTSRQQTLSNIEIIFIDDGSTDKTANLLQEYKMTDNRVQIITHPKNLGLGAARNTGMAEANGTYIFFLDSDDYIHPNALEVLYDKSQAENLDILQAQHIEHRGDTKTTLPKNIIPFTQAIDGINYYNEGIFIEPKACAKLWKTDFIKQHNLQFSQGYYEDMAMVFYAFSIAKRLNNLMFPAYHYVIRNNSITQQKPSAKHILDFMQALSATQEGFIKQKLINKHSSFPASFGLFLVKLNEMSLQTNQKDLQNQVQNFTDQMLKNYAKFIKQNKQLSFWKRILIAKSPLLYAQLKKIIGRA